MRSEAESCLYKERIAKKGEIVSNRTPNRSTFLKMTSRNIMSSKVDAFFDMVIEMACAIGKQGREKEGGSKEEEAKEEEEARCASA